MAGKKYFRLSPSSATFPSSIACALLPLAYLCFFFTSHEITVE
jgi:hypothetical protein